MTGVAPSGLQLDLLTVIARLEQIDAEDRPRHFVWERVITCDVRRLRGYLTPETLAWEAALDAGLRHEPPPAG